MHVCAIVGHATKNNVRNWEAGNGHLAAAEEGSLQSSLELEPYVARPTSDRVSQE